MKVNFKHVFLSKHENETIYLKDEECCVVILSGRCDVYVMNQLLHENFGQRNHVFEGKAHAIYIPRETEMRITAVSDSLEAAVISTYAQSRYDPFIITPAEITKESRGMKEWRRDVYDIISHSHKTESLFVGESYHTNGVWSGYPPHKHDTDDGNKESINEEVYFIKIEPDTGFGIFVQYDDADHKNCKIVENNNTIYVEKGYHSIVSSGGHKFYYLWALSSKNKKFMFSGDGAFSWINKE